jgi:hypothetical protein
MLLHRLIRLHRVQAGSVEPGQQHVPHHDDLERIAELGLLAVPGSQATRALPPYPRDSAECLAMLFLSVV